MEKIVSIVGRNLLQDFPVCIVHQKNINWIVRFESRQHHVKALVCAETRPISNQIFSSPPSEGPGEDYEDIEGFSKATTIAEVQKQDYKLTPGIYVGTEAEEDDGIPFEEKMQTLKAELLEQFEKGEELKERIKANFDKII